MVWNTPHITLGLHRGSTDSPTTVGLRHNRASSSFNNVAPKMAGHKQKAPGGVAGALFFLGKSRRSFHGTYTKKQDT